MKKLLNIVGIITFACVALIFMFGTLFMTWGVWEGQVIFVKAMLVLLNFAMFGTIITAGLTAYTNHKESK